MKTLSLIILCAVVVSGIGVSAANDPKRIPGPGETEFMRFSDTTFRIYGNVALVTGVTDFRAGRPGPGEVARR